MIRYPPVRTRLLVLHVLLGLVLVGLLAAAAWRLFAFPPDPAGAAALAGIVVGLVLLPPTLYRILFLLTAEYAIHPSGGLTLRFGSRREILPIEEIEEIRSGSRIPDSIRRVAPGWLEMWHGRIEPAGEEPVEWLATERGPGLLMLITKRQHLAISPANPAEFARTLTDLSTRGGLEKIEPASEKPSPVLAEIVRNPAGIGLLTGGLAGITALGAFLTAIQPALPADQPFRFDPSGAPTSLGDPVRLLILPLAGGMVWMVNAILGWWTWRRGQRPAAYALWAVSFIVATGLWMASASLLAAR